MFGKAGIAALALLGGCATDAIRVERANTVAAAGKASAESTRGLLREVDTANRQTAIDAATLDPDCELPSPLIGISRPLVPLLCRRGEAIGADFTLARLRPRDFAPALATIEGLAVYIGEIDAIVTGATADSGAVEAAEGNLTGTLGQMTAAAPGVADDKRAAVQGALELLGTIAAEQRQVGDLRRLSTPEATARFDATVAALARDNAVWTKLLDAELAKQLAVTRAALVLLRERDRMGERRMVRERQMIVLERQAELPALRAALDALTAELTAAHAAYQKLLSGGPREFTDDERRRAARLTRTRLIAALKTVSNLVKSF